ncbi:hypothetical protein [Sphingomicrobium aestuariivivum]|nr:hypothetical protein [Sphingomicrobium aestuariivivum]
MKQALLSGGRRMLASWALLTAAMLMFIGWQQGWTAALVAAGPLAFLTFKMALRMHAGGTIGAAIAPHLPREKPGRVRDLVFFEDPQGRDPLALLEAYGEMLAAAGAQSRFMGGLDVTRGEAHHVITPAPVGREYRIDSEGADRAARSAFIESFTTHLGAMGVVAAGSARPDPEIAPRRGFGRRA